MGPIPVSFDVTEAVGADIAGGARLQIAAWLFIPADLCRLASGRPAVIALLNGGTYDKRYFHVEIPGHPGYSMAEDLAARGYIVVLPDHLGIGESSRVPDQKQVTRQVAASANHAAMEMLYARLRTGDLHPALPALLDFLKIGGGHSMGGMQIITQQAEHHTYDRVLVLGYTGIGVHLTVNGRQVAAHREIDPSHPDYWLADRKFLRASFHWGDVPEAVIAADDAILVEVPYVLGTQATQTGIVSADAARIEVPVYICLGERDVSPDPHREPSYYTASRDVTLHILPRSGHCQNFAGTRGQMFDRIDGWVRSIPG